MTAERRKVVWICCAGLHFFFISVVCWRDTFSVLSGPGTISPGFLTPLWHNCDELASSALGLRLGRSNLIRRLSTAYLRIAGIEGGYGFFAPTVPYNYNLVFEVHNEDGSVNYELPEVSGLATGLRLSTLLDNIGQTRDDPLRELMLKMLAYPIWQRHPGAKKLRAVFGFVDLPTATQFR